MSEENQDYQESENTDEEQGNSEEQDSEQQSSEQSAEGSEKDYSELYENQKTRAEKAEAKLKELKQQLSDDSEGTEKPSEEQTSKKQNLPETPSAEELRLIAQKGYDDDELDKLRKIAQVEEVSLSDAANSDLFSSWKQSRDTQKKQEAAQMGGSHGSGRQTQEKSVSDPDLSAEEHKRLWQQQMGR